MELGVFLFFFIVVPFALVNFTKYRKERMNSDEQLQTLLKENNELLKELLASLRNN